MNKVSSLQSQIEGIRKELKEDSDNKNRFDNYSGLKRGQISKMLSRIKMCNLAIQYLKSEPTETFVTMELNRLSGRKDKIMNEYDVWSKTPRPQQFKNEKEKLKFYQKELGIPKINIQIKTLRFILNK